MATSKDGLAYSNHAVTQAFIAIFLILMIIVFVDMCIKFYCPSKPTLPHQQASVKSQASISTTGSHSDTIYTKSAKKQAPTVLILKFYKITSIVCISCFILSVAIDFGDGVYYFASGIDVFHTNEYWLIALTNFFWGISAICLYIFIFGRLYLTFKETEHALKRATIIIVVSLIIINSFASLMYICCYFVRFNHLSLGLFYELLNASNIFILVTDIVVNIFILGLFAFKLQQIFMDWGEYEDIANLRGSIDVNKAQIKLAACLTKHVILSSLAMISNVLFYGSVIAGSNIQPIWVVDLYFLGYSNLIKALSGFVVTSSIYLNLGLKNKTYLVLFSKCHDLLQTSFIKMNKKKIKEERVNDDDADVVDLDVNQSNDNIVR